MFKNMSDAKHTHTCAYARIHTQNKHIHSHIHRHTHLLQCQHNFYLKIENKDKKKSYIKFCRIIVKERIQFLISAEMSKFVKFNFRDFKIYIFEKKNVYSIH